MSKRSRVLLLDFRVDWVGFNRYASSMSSFNLRLGRSSITWMMKALGDCQDGNSAAQAGIDGECSRSLLAGRYKAYFGVSFLQVNCK